MNPDVFREYDIRGVVEKDLDNEFVRDLGRAIGTYARERSLHTFTLGRDCRLSSQEYSEAIAEGLSSTGINVADIGLCATPMLYFSIRHLAADGGIMVTGSHNPPDFNGFKICIGTDTIFGDEIQKLRTIMEKGNYISGKGKIFSRSVIDAYNTYIYKNVSVRKSFKVAVDGGNGVGGFFALPILSLFGCSLYPLYCDMDGLFPHHFPDPTIEENLADLICLVKKNSCDLGIAFDGDADRLGVITKKGKIIWGDELLLLFSRFILKERPGATIIGEVKCSRKLYKDIEKNGGRPIMWKAGHSLIKEKMKEENAVLAGEMSGHFFFADRYFGYDDGIYAAARLLEILSRSDMNLDEILSDVPETYSTPEIRIDCDDSIKFTVIEKIKKYFSTRYHINSIDGARLEFDDGWGLVRASNTQPVLVLRFESESEAGLGRIRGEIEGAVFELIECAV